MLKLLLAAVAVSAATPIAALGQDTPLSVRVHVGDLDLTSPAGARALDRRIGWAAGKICPTDWNTDLSRRLRTKACRAAVIANAATPRDNAIANAAAHRSTVAAVTVQAAGAIN